MRQPRVDGQVDAVEDIGLRAARKIRLPHDQVVGRLGRKLGRRDGVEPAQRLPAQGQPRIGRYRDAVRIEIAHRAGPLPQGRHREVVRNREVVPVRPDVGDAQGCPGQQFLLETRGGLPVVFSIIDPGVVRDIRDEVDRAEPGVVLRPAFAVGGVVEQIAVGGEIAVAVGPLT